MNLMCLATGYLKAAGYATSQRGRDLLIGTRRTILGQETETVLVWAPTMDPGHPFATREGPYLARFQAAVDEYPLAQKFMLVPTFEGITPQFRSGAKQWHNVNIRVPIQFFDTPFKGEESPEAREAGSAVAALRTRGQELGRVRVPQPYSVKSDTPGGEDLLPSILERLEASPAAGEKSVHVIVGPAGVGKTVLFESLFGRLYSNFLESKRALHVLPRPRPLPLLPEYLRVSVAPTLKALVDAFLATDFAAPVTRSVFEWMMTNGLAIWLLDGLDEVIARDPDFFGYLLELLTFPGGSPPRIVVCVRDSLLATNDDFRDFCEGYSTHVEIYELAKWQMQSKRRFAELTLREKADGFLAVLRQRLELEQLSSTPYYCALIADQYKAGKLRDSYTESQLLSDALSSIINREYEKGLLDKNLVPETDIREFLESLAAEDMENEFRGIQRDVIEEWARILLPVDLAPDDFERLVTHILQLAVFTRGAVVPNVQFAQEILEHYLLGEHLTRSVEGNRAVFVRRLSHRQIPNDWVTLRIVAERLKAKGAQNDLIQLVSVPIPPIAFKNILQIAALAVDDPTALKNVPLERRDLSGLLFRRLDFRSTSFRGSDLTDVEFDGCDLREASFDGSIIKNTGFLVGDKEHLRGAHFGEMERFFSLRTEAGRILSDFSAVRRWIDQYTGIPAEIVEPCGPAQQLRYLFGKFIHPNGTPKRSLLDRRGALAGKHPYDPEDTLRAAIKHGYLAEEERFRDRVKRADGDAYSEMVDYVRNLALSEGIRNLLADLCPAEGCPHVPSS